MRGDTWPGGAIRQYGHVGDAVPTISGVLQVREGLWGHKWVYKLHDIPQGFVRTELGARCWIRITAVIAICILVAVGIAFTLFGPKYLEHDSIIWPPDYTNNRLKIILNLYNKSSNQWQEKSDQESTMVYGCFNCSTSDICLQNPSELNPECVPIIDATDPTGCGGLCALEVQSCKRLSPKMDIYSCLDIQTLHCSETEWKCRETLLCIDQNRVCDGIIHCFDQSDEFNCECDLETSFRCGNNISCFSNDRKCNGAVDCWDAHDEMNCTHECGLLQIPCYNGECIGAEKFCDGIYDCGDQSDEPNGCLESRALIRGIHNINN